MAGQLALMVGLSDRACFENFFIGANAEALDSVRRLADGSPGLVYLYGEAGAGKTHLLYAAQKAALAADRRASYVSMSDEQVLDHLGRFDGSLALVCVDDAHEAAGCPSAEQFLFNLIEILGPSPGGVLVASRKPPSECGFRMADLVSRLNSGASFRLSQLTDSDKSSAMRLRAEYRGFHLPDEVVAYVMRKFPRDTAALFGLLDRIDRYSLSKQRMVTIPLIKELESGTGQD